MRIAKWFLLILVAAGGLAVAGLAGCSCALTTTPEVEQDKPATGVPERLALLVGCTEYVNPRITALSGPGNDIPRFAQLLKSRFGFNDGEITQLVAWPDDPAKRPTYANITKAFEKLIEKAGEGTQVVIVMAGHGVQVPIPETQTDPLDPKNPEPDGMDEVFLPADAKEFSKDGLVNAIRDNDFGDWLDRLRDKGAAVWIIFDCCHAGDMMRGAEQEPLERPRMVDPIAALGVTTKQVNDAVKRAQEAVLKQTKGERPRDVAPAHSPLVKAEKKKGSVVAFYAAQPFEVTYELPRPTDAPRVPENYYGLLSYTLTSLLEQSERKMTYHELAQTLVAHYRSERGARGPTPAFEGAMDREVLGVKEWPGRSEIVLKREKKKLFVEAGLLRGLTPGSVLAVYPPAAKKGDTVVGHVRVTKATPERAEVEPCPAPDAKEGSPAAPTGKLPELGRCKIVLRDLGEMRLKVAVHAATPADAADADRVRAALGQIEPAVRELFAEVKDAAVADWLLWVEQGQVRLRLGAGTDLGPKAKEVATGAPSAKVRAEYAGYATTDPKSLASQVGADLQTIYTWRNVWRVAGTAASPSAAASEQGLRVQVYRLAKDDKGDKLAGLLPVGAPVVPPPNPDDGIPIRLALTNLGPQDLWVSVLFLDGDMGIQHVRSMPMKADKDLTVPLTGQIDSSTQGREGFVVLAVPQEVSPFQPNFKFLEQPGLSRDKARGPQEKAVPAANTPFMNLMRAATIGKGTRAFRQDAPSNPTIYSWSWITLPPAGKGK